MLEDSQTELYIEKRSIKLSMIYLIKKKCRLPLCKTIQIWVLFIIDYSTYVCKYIRWK